MTKSQNPLRECSSPTGLSSWLPPFSSGPVCLFRDAGARLTHLPSCTLSLGLQVPGELGLAKQRGPGWLEFLQGRLRVGDTGPAFETLTIWAEGTLDSETCGLTQRTTGKKQAHEIITKQKHTGLVAAGSQGAVAHP